MINPTKGIVMIVTDFKTQFKCKTYKRSNSRFYATRVCLKEVYLIKYTGNFSHSTLNPFKVKVL